MASGGCAGGGGNCVWGGWRREGGREQENGAEAGGRGGGGRYKGVKMFDSFFTSVFHLDSVPVIKLRSGVCHAFLLVP